MKSELIALPEMLGYLPLVALLAWAVATDLRHRLIPNWLTASLVATGLVQAALPNWPVTIAQAWGGMWVGFGLTFVLFALGAMGGGDVKLFAGIGAWVGPARALEVFAAAALAGMVIVLWQAARGGRLTSLARGSAVIVLNAAHGDLACPAESAEESKGKRRLPYAVPALVATVAVLSVGRRWL